LENRKEEYRIMQGKKILKKIKIENKNDFCTLKTKKGIYFSKTVF